jgi:hypothetical protein
MLEMFKQYNVPIKKLRFLWDENIHRGSAASDAEDVAQLGQEKVRKCNRILARVLELVPRLEELCLDQEDEEIEWCQD